jgi:hypothetical protein
VAIFDSQNEKPQSGGLRVRELLGWRTYTSMKSHLGRGYVGGAPNVGGNRCRCILVRFSSLSICAQMNTAGAVIVGSSTRTTHALEPKSEVKRGILTKRKSCAAARAFNRNKYSAMPAEARRKMHI